MQLRLEQLRAGHASVGELVDQLALPQPTVSKHLRVLRQAGFVTCRTAAQQRIYSLHREPFDEFDAWLHLSCTRLADFLDRSGICAGGSGAGSRNGTLISR